MRDKTDLRQRQALPLIAKVRMSQARIAEWYRYFGGNVCVSFSGGKDSTVLAHLVHEYYPDVPLVFADTGLEYPEIRKFAESMGAEFVRPKMRFDEVISKYGYPIISKEVADAIFYARRIRPSEGGWTIKPSGKRNQILGRIPVQQAHNAHRPQRPSSGQKCSASVCIKNCMGGGTGTIYLPSRKRPSIGNGC